MTANKFMSETVNTPEKCTVYFDGSCPLCRAEIDHYKKSGADAQFCDITDQRALPDGLDPSQAMKRFHVARKDGRLLSGAAAFAEVWKSTPGWRWLGVIVSRRPVVWIAELFYRAFLLVRPWVQVSYRKLAQASSNNH
jgi:predicted DCC family thiol-disulfide oxidoreductase YuxK